MGAQPNHSSVPRSSVSGACVATKQRPCQRVAMSAGGDQQEGEILQLQEVSELFRSSFPQSLCEIR